MARALNRKVNPKVNRRYVLLPREQHRKGGVPVGNSLFKGANIVETDENLDQFLGLLIARAPEPKVESVPEPAPVRVPEPALARVPAPDPETVADPEPEPEPEEVKSRGRGRGRKSKDED